MTSLPLPKLKGNLRIIRFVWPYKTYIVIIVLCMILFSMLHVISLASIPPIVDKVLVKGNEDIVIFDLDEAEAPSDGRDVSLKVWINNKAAGRKPSEVLWVIGVFLLVVIILKGLTGFLKNYLIARLSRKVVMNIRNAVYAHLQYLSFDFYSKAKTGEIISRFTNDISMIQGGISKGFCEAIFQPIQIVFYASILFLCEPVLALVCLVMIPVLIIPIIKIGKKMKKIGLAWQEKMGGLASIIQETITGIRIVKAFGMEKYEIDKFQKENKRLFKIFMRFEIRKLMLPPMLELVGALGVVFMLTYGGRMVLSGELTKGNFLLFVIALVSMLQPFKKLGKVNSVIQMMLASTQRVYNILDVSRDITNSSRAAVISDVNDSIVFENVSFSYPREAGSPDETVPVLKNISFSIKKGEVVAFVGASGSGKTTLLNLIPRFYDVLSGRITIDNIDIRDLDLACLRGLLGIVTQDTVLFNDTVEGNIVYGQKNWTHERLIEAAKQAHAHEFIVGLPNGYQTFIGERGVKLSGGQKQRLTIARALMKNSPVLILDEATSSLDTESERLVQDAIERLMEGRTVFAVAHRLSTIIHANRIFVIDDNRIVDSGSHTELLGRNQLYKKMYDLQFKETKKQHIADTNKKR